MADDREARTVPDRVRPSRAEVPREEPHYELGKVIAEGGMGRVRTAFDRRLGRTVALKEILDLEFRDRFEREVRITARLQHPAIVPIYEAGALPDGTAFYAMRMVPGQTLQDAIDGSTFSDRLRLVPHLRAAADALAYAHSQRVIHRDLKPGNILVGPFGETVVIDWGLARDLDSDDVPAEGKAAVTSAQALTVAGSVLGTPGFMSPAQARGEPALASDDVYALGAILYTVLAGTAPFVDIVGKNAEALIAGNANHDPTPIDELAPRADADLRALVTRAMAREREDRYRDAGEFAAELARFEAGRLLASREYTTRELFARWLKKNRRIAIAAGIASALAVVALLFGLRYLHAADELRARERGAALTELYTDVSRQGRTLGHELAQIEATVDALSTAAGYALVGPDPGPDVPVYFSDHFAADKGAVNGAYRWRVSVEDLVVGVAPGVDREPLMPQIRRLTAMRGQFRQLAIQAAGLEPNKDRVVDNSYLLARKGPIDYAYVDLPQGVHVLWPGSASLRDDYDVRTASFYANGLDRHVPKWGAPYIDSSTDQAGDDLVLPCTKGVWSPTGEMLGVAGAEVTVTKLVETGLGVEGRHVLRASLVDASGRTVLDSSEANKRFKSNGRDEALALAEFDVPEIATAIRSGEEGVREVVRGGTREAVAFMRLDAIGVTYVIEVDGQTLGR